MKSINLEPNWAGLRLWALNGQKSPNLTPRERKAFRDILRECEIAKTANRPSAKW